MNWRAFWRGVASIFDPYGPPRRAKPYRYRRMEPGSYASLWGTCARCGCRLGWNADPRDMEVCGPCDRYLRRTYGGRQ